MIGGDPAHPDVAAELDIFVVVDRPAVHRSSLRRSPVDKVGVFPQCCNGWTYGRRTHGRRRATT
jgi:hypothetical protein